MGINSSQELCDVHFITICEELRWYDNRHEKTYKEMIYSVFIVQFE